MTVERLGTDLLVSGYPSHPERELDIRTRPAGQTDADAVDQLLSAQVVAGANLRRTTERGPRR